MQFFIYSNGACPLIIAGKESSSVFLFPLPDSDIVDTYLWSQGSFFFFSFRDFHAFVLKKWIYFGSSMPVEYCLVNIV